MECTYNFFIFISVMTSDSISVSKIGWGFCKVTIKLAIILESTRLL